MQIKEEKIAELMFDIWHKSNDLKNPVMVGEYIAKELSKVKNLDTPGVLDEMIEYIEEKEVEIDGEWGNCRSLKDIIKDENMPDLYNTLIALKTNNEQNN